MEEPKVDISDDGSINVELNLGKKQLSERQYNTRNEMTEPAYASLDKEMFKKGWINQKGNHLVQDLMIEKDFSISDNNYYFKLKAYREHA